MMLWADSFDHYGETESNLTDGAWAEAGLGISLSTVMAGTGTHSLLIAGNDTQNARRVFGASYARVGVALRVFYPALPLDNDTSFLMEFCNAGNEEQIQLICQTTGVLAVYAGRAGGGFVSELLAESTTLLTANGWNHVEMFVHCAEAGTVEVRLNGVTVVNYAGDTRGFGTASLAQLRMRNTSLGSGGMRYIDDVIAWEADTTGAYNDDFIGDKKVFTDFPDADMNESGFDDWFPLSGAEMYPMVDDPDPDGDSTYCQADEVGQRMGLLFPDVNPATIEIRAVCLVHKSRKSDAGTGFLQMSSRSGTAEVAGEDRPVTTVYALYNDVFEYDPDTLAPWTPSGVNAMAAVLERTA